MPTIYVQQSSTYLAVVFSMIMLPWLYIMLVGNQSKQHKCDYQQTSQSGTHSSHVLCLIFVWSCKKSDNSSISSDGLTLAAQAGMETHSIAVKKESFDTTNITHFFAVGLSDNKFATGKVFLIVQNIVSHPGYLVIGVERHLLNILN